MEPHGRTGGAFLPGYDHVRLELCQRTAGPKKRHVGSTVANTQNITNGQGVLEPFSMFFGALISSSGNFRILLPRRLFRQIGFIAMSGWAVYTEYREAFLGKTTRSLKYLQKVSCPSRERRSDLKVGHNGGSVRARPASFRLAFPGQISS